MCCLLRSGPSVHTLQRACAMLSAVTPLVVHCCCLTAIYIYSVYPNPDTSVELYTALPSLPRMPYWVKPPGFASSSSSNPPQKMISRWLIDAVMMMQFCSSLSDRTRTGEPHFDFRTTLYTTYHSVFCWDALCQQTTTLYIYIHMIYTILYIRNYIIRRMYIISVINGTTTHTRQQQ